MSPIPPRARSVPFAFAFLAASLALAASAGAQTQRNFGRTDSIALDQPRVDVEYRDPDTGEVVGPGFIGRSFIADTGANGSVVGQFGHFKPLEDTGGFPVIDPDLYDVAGEYAELGVGGFSFFNLHEEYTQAHRGIQRDPETGELEAGPFHTIEGFNALGKPDLSLGSFGGIAGMPAMVDHRVRMDPTTMTPLGYMHTSILDPGGSGSGSPGAARQQSDSPTTHRVNLDRLPVEFSNPEQDPLPDFAPLPLMNEVTTTTTPENTGGDPTSPATETFLLDTGAQMSMLMGETARAMGIDPIEDAQDFLPVSGVSGTTEIPLVQLDQLRIPTAQSTGPNAADELVFEDLVVGILDLHKPNGDPFTNEELGFGGILGSNALTSGYLEHLFTDNDGFFQEINLDFTGEQWFMELIENPDFERATDDSELNLAASDEDDGVSDALEDVFELRSLTGGSPWVMLATDPVTHLGAVSTQIPTPGTIALLGAGAAGLAASRRRRRRRSAR